MARQPNRSKLPAKENAAAKVAGCLQPTAEAGMVVYFKGEQLTLRQESYGSFKKLLKVAIDMQKRDPNFSWLYFDKLPE